MYFALRSDFPLFYKSQVGNQTASSECYQNRSYSVKQWEISLVHTRALRLFGRKNFQIIIMIHYFYSALPISSKDLRAGRS